MKRRKIPIRTCVACRTSGDKRTLLRIVRTAGGEVAVDVTGKMPGRGAYLCPSAECLRRALKEKRLSRALRAEIPEEALQQLAPHAAGLEKTIEQGSEEM